MAFLVATDDRIVQLSRNPGEETQIPGDFTVLKGETFQPSHTALLHDSLWKPDLRLLSSIDGEFSFVHYSQAAHKVHFGTDRLGRENLFYYTDGKRLVVGDDFWEVVSHLDIGISDIDAQSLKEFITLNYPVFYGTIVKNVSFVPPSTYGEFCLRTGELRFVRYWDFRYTPDTSASLTDAVEQMDAALDQTFRQIQNLNSGVTYGVGLSGGLDSRLIPHYALKNHMPISSFIIGQSRPHIIFLSRDHHSARAIADFYGIHHTEVECDADRFEEKMQRDVRNYPMGASQFFISVENVIPDFDVLLTGASGMLVGSEIPPSIMHMNRAELLDAMLSHCSLLGKSSTFLQKVGKGVREIAGLPASARQNSIGMLKSFYSRDEFGTITDKFSGLINRSLDAGKSNLDVYQDYFVFFLGSRNKCGAFESLQGLKKSYSIYTSRVLDATLTWRPEFLLDRLVLKETIRWVIPRLAAIEAQDHRPPIATSGSPGSASRMTAMVKYLVRGQGVGRHEAWARSKAYQRYAHRILHRPNAVFDSIAGPDKVKLLCTSSPRFFEKLVKAKVILDLFDSGEYKKLAGMQHGYQQPVRIWTS